MNSYAITLEATVDIPVDGGHRVMYIKFEGIWSDITAMRALDKAESSLRLHVCDFSDRMEITNILLGQPE
jgi:CRISPR/Cas system-associated exonuclease Cas4 (RecB family)